MLLQWRQTIATVVPTTLLAFAVGCSLSTKPTAIEPLSIDSTAAAKRAIQSYDSDGSGELDQEEVTASPGLWSAFQAVDGDGSGSITQAELEAYLSELYSGGVGLVPATCRVSAGRRPLAGVTVRFAPAEFLGDVLKPAEGITDNQGIAVMAVADDDLPADQQGLHAVQPGIYRIQVEHPAAESSEEQFGFVINPSSRSSSRAQVRL